MKIVNRKFSSITVQIEKTISVGQTVRINSSYGFAGIDGGIVEILAIGYMGDLYADESLNDMIGSIGGYIETEVSICNTAIEGTNLKSELESSVWVAYIYKSKDSRNYSKDTIQYSFPLDIFVSHTSIA